LASPAHLQVHLVVLHVDELDEAPVPRHRWIDGGVDQLLHPNREIFAHGSPLLGVDQITTVLDLPLRANWPLVGSARQNQGSVRGGGRGRPAGSGSATGGPAGAPAAAPARARTRSKVTAGSSRRSAASVTCLVTASWSRSIRGSGWRQR